MKIQPLTLLQRGVILRLREIGRHQLADAANAAWSKGERCRLAIEVGDATLRADYEKANAQLLAEDC